MDSARITSDQLDMYCLIEDLISARTIAGISQIKLANKMKVSRNMVVNLEKQYTDSRIWVLQRYARAVGGQIKIEFVPDKVENADR